MRNISYFKEFIKYVSLNVLGMLGLSCYILADTFFIAKGLGANGIAALNLAIPVYSFIHGTGLMLGMGGATKYSIYQGIKEHKKANILFTNTLYIAAVVAFIFVFTGAFLSKSITALLGADNAVFAMTNTYLKVILLFAPAFLMNDILICFVRNDGNPKLSMFAMLTGSLSNILLDYLFIFPLGWGMFGAVFATGLAPIISIFILSWHWLKKQNKFYFIKTKPLLTMTWPILSLGFPSLVTEVSSGIGIIVLNIIILGLQGNTGVAAYGIIANLSLVVVAVYTGIAQGIQPLISKAHGTASRFHIQKLLRYAMASLLAISALLYCVIFLFANPIAYIFNSENNPWLRQIAVVGLRLYFISAVFVGFNIIISVFFTSTENAVPAHIISILRGLVIIIPMAFILSGLWGITGVWLAFPITEMLVCILGVGMYCTFRKRIHGQ